MTATSDQIPEQPKTLFDLPESEGVNESERILTSLCRKSFLRLWSQTNVFTDEGFKDGKGGTKELCDALVVFGNDVIIFSDKHIVFQADREISVAWPRWYKRAVFDSVKQLHGAKGWLQKFPERAYLDAKCSRLLPVSLPPMRDIRFHLVAVTRGSHDAVLAYHGGAGLGSFMIDSSIEGFDHEKRPFCIGQPMPEKQFVHVFDEVSIELLMRELDTTADVIDYLTKREVLLGRRGTQIVAPGEEELLGAYLINMNQDESEHVFLNLPNGDDIPEAVFFAGDHFERLINDPGYRRKKEADTVSYIWDDLIERFTKYGDPSLHDAFGSQASSEIEKGLRLMAAESRYRRRQLSGALMGALERVSPGERLGRLMYGGVAGETVFVFVVVPQRRNESYPEYRHDRISILHAYVRTAKLKAPLGTTFVGIAMDNPHKEERGGSEDLMVWSQDTWTGDQLIELEEKRVELGLWGKAMEYSRFRQDEFPQANQSIAIERVVSPSEDKAVKNPDSRKDKKHIRKVKKDSKRRNRR